MSRKIIPAAAAAILLASTAFASAQTRENPRYWGGSGYQYGGPSVTFGIGPGVYGPGYGPGYSGYGPGYSGYYSRGYYDYAPGWSCGISGCNDWND
jgi:hypothetical protein